MRRRLTIVAAVMLIIGAATGCSHTVDGQAVSVGAADNEQKGHVNTNQYDKLLLECQVLSTDQIAKAVGGSAAQGTFNGAICRWLVQGSVSANVTFNWFENGDPNVEKDTAKRLGYQTDNVRIASQAAFTQRDPRRPAVCGVTARAPSRGVYTWWVEPVGAGAPGDPCAAPTKLMQLLLSGGQ